MVSYSLSLRAFGADDGVQVWADVVNDSVIGDSSPSSLQADVCNIEYSSWMLDWANTKAE